MDPSHPTGFGKKKNGFRRSIARSFLLPHPRDCADFAATQATAPTLRDCAILRKGRKVQPWPEAPGHFRSEGHAVHKQGTLATPGTALS